MKRITLVLAAGAFVLASCRKHEGSEGIVCEEEVRIPQSCAEYEEMKANGELMLKEDHWATCTCPITCHFDDLK